MAILAALVAVGSRFATKILTTALGWASTLLFGRVPASRQISLLGITFGSVIWVVLVVGVLVPDVGAFLLLLVPPQDVIPTDVIRLGMLIGAIAVPAIVGVLILSLAPPGERGGRRAVESILRGYPLTVVLAGLLVFLAGLAIYRRARSAARRWSDAHVPLIVEPGAYDEVARDLDDAISAAGLDVTARPAPAVMSTPAKWLAAVAGRGSAVLVPNHMVQLHGPDLDILIYPMDLLISGKPVLVMRARAAMASRLTTSAAHLTVTAEAQGIEDRLASLLRPAREPDGEDPMFDDRARLELESIDELLATIEIPYEEWEVLYRQRLQVDRDLRAQAMTRTDALEAAIAPVQRTLRSSAGAVIEAATDDRTIETLDRLAGPVWTVGLRVTAASASLALRVLRGVGDRRATLAGEPLTVEPAPAAPSNGDGGLQGH